MCASLHISQSPGKEFFLNIRLRNRDKLSKCWPSLNISQSAIKIFVHQTSLKSENNLVDCVHIRKCGMNDIRAKFCSSGRGQSCIWQPWCRAGTYWEGSYRECTVLNYGIFKIKIFRLRRRSFLRLLSNFIFFHFYASRFLIFYFCDLKICHFSITNLCKWELTNILSLIKCHANFV